MLYTTIVTAILLIGIASPGWAQQATFAGNAQHTAQFNGRAQPLNAVHWTVPVDLVNTGSLAHYAVPLITPSNTVVAPVRTAAGFQISAYEGGTGRLKYTLTNDYELPPLPTNSWIPVYQPVIANPPSGPRLYYAGAGGTIYYATNLDSDIAGAVVHQCFYTNLAGYNANASNYNGTIFINTPITADTNGVIFFGFRVQQIAPDPLNTGQSGFARIDPQGASTYVLAGNASSDGAITRDSHNSAPALSNDGATLYVPVKSTTTGFYAYLLGLDTTNLATKYKVPLHDPFSANYAGVLDDSTASPTIGPDGDVYLGVVGDPTTGRGYLLHFSADLKTNKLPASFGWDYTPVIVPTNLVPEYTGPSSYLLFSKYNNYAGFIDGNGVNRIALLDPNAAQVDAHPSAGGLVEMREVLTVSGATPDHDYQGQTYPYATLEWCINTGAVNPDTKSVFAPSEDGHIYRWNIASNCVTELLSLGPAVGSPYVPTTIGPDGAVYTIHGGKLLALGGLTNLAVGVHSSAPDVRYTVAGQGVTFTAVVTNLTGSVLPAGSVRFEDVTYIGHDPITNILADNVVLTNGLAAVTTTNLSAGANQLGNHFITAFYSGDTNFSKASATLLQVIHAQATAMTLSSALSTNVTGDTVTFTADVTQTPSSSAVPSGLVSFWDGMVFLGQTPLDTNGVTVFTNSGLSGASHAVSARYASDTMNASSGASLVGTPPYVQGAIARDSAFQLSFTNVIGAPFTVLRCADLAAPDAAWTNAGRAVEVFPGQFQFSDHIVTNGGSGYYRVRSPD